MRIRKTSIGRAEVAFLAIGGLFIGALGCKNDSGGAKTESSAKAEEGKKTETEQASEGPKVVPGPGYLPECFAPWAKDTKYLQWPARKPPFRIALVNGYVGNAWRIQMVKTAKTYAKDPAVAPLIKEFKVVSTGTDIAAQLGAIEDFINQGFDGIVTLAVSPEGFDRVIKLADKKGVIIVPFDNVLDTDKVMQVNEDQLSMGKQWGEFIDKGMKGLSLGESPGLAAIAMKATIEGLQGRVLPQKISVPIPAADHTTLKDGENYYSKLSDNFFTPNEFPPCGVNISGVKIMNESETDMK